ncbi:MAG: sigma-54-dependent Fis family transcriptional regulator [Lentisphaeria bacterium]|nr:sigma-54-dependent Fis family transcriptional regulator [Lentisphaeria bacterium]
METILMTSGFRPEALAAARRQWQVVDIDCQRDGLAHLRRMEQLPHALCIGRTMDIGDDLDAWEMLEAVRAEAPGIPVVISTQQTSPKVIVDLMKKGAFDYVVEAPSDDLETIARYAEDLAFSLQRAVAWRQVVMENRQLRDDLAGQSGQSELIGDSPPMQRIAELLDKVAPTDATVLITGESGTGKELAARRVHERSPRRNDPFVALNCGAFSETLIASELFGHVKGAFTGADMDRPGVIREAAGGTIFLDEIATLPLNFQVMLLRVLEERRARPVGGTGDYEVNCRFVAAANQNLQRLLEERRFREDLFYRLNVFAVRMPALRDRREDIPLLADHFLRQASTRYGRDVKSLSTTAMALLEAAEWKGNVRELRNAIERAVILSEKGTLDAHLFEPQMRIGSGERHTYTPDTADYLACMRKFECQLLSQTLEETGGNRSEAARRLGVNRQRLNYRLRLLGLA